jgi:hypothetical protein
MRTVRCSLLLLSLSALPLFAAPAQHVIDKVSIDRASFDPAANDLVTLVVRFSRPGTASIVVVDRDGYRVRKLDTGIPVDGAFSVTWNGRDDAGEVVADEAYSFRIDWRSPAGRAETYFPANRRRPCNRSRRTTTTVVEGPSPTSCRHPHAFTCRPVLPSLTRKRTRWTVRS